MKKKLIKKDLSEQPATQGDLDTWGGELTKRLDKMATKEELRSEIEKSEARVRADIRKSEKRLIFEFKAAVENIHDDLAGANKDEISAMKDTDTKLEERVAVLEKHVLHH